MYRFLGYDWIPPELRENGGELAAARKGELPALVELERPARRPAHAHDVVGRQGHARGHGRGGDRARLRVLRGLRPLAAAARRAAARSSRRRSTRSTSSWRRFAILKGIEVNIRRTARSTSRTTSSRRATGSSRRCTRASTTIRPSASWPRWRARTSTAIGHPDEPQDRQARQPAPIDVERVIEKALETGTFLEINSQPDRLDLTDVHARAAREAGLKLVIDSDGHQIARARLRRARRRPGAARVADEGRRREHAHVEADREAAEEAVTFRDDLDRAADWVDDYLAPRRRAARRRAGRARARCARGCPSRRPSRASRSRRCCATSTR